LFFTIWYHDFAFHMKFVSLQWKLLYWLSIEIFEFEYFLDEYISDVNFNRTSYCKNFYKDAIIINKEGKGLMGIGAIISAQIINK